MEPQHGAPSANHGADREMGTVSWFSHKGFGYLTTDAGGDVYVHHSAIVGSGFRSLPTGARVSFAIVSTPRGPEATDVRIIDED
jgi:CspA family cold shock protein